MFILAQEGNTACAREGGIVPPAIRPVDRPRPTAAVVARRAIKKRWMRGKALSVEPVAFDIRRQENAGKRDGDSNERALSATCVCSSYIPGGVKRPLVSLGTRYELYTKLQLFSRLRFIERHVL